MALATLPERETKAAAVAELYAEGLTGIKIAERLGISRSYAYELLNDPSGTEATKRKAKAGGICTDCGGPTTYGNAARGPAKRCQDCQFEHAHATRKWTPETIIAAIQRWADIVGHPPTATHWNTAHANHRGEVARLFRDGDFPVTNTVREEFGTWSAGIAAAGFQPRQAWGHRGLSDAAYERTAAAHRKGIPIAEIARHEGVTDNAIRTRLIKLGVYQPTSRRKEIMAASLKAEQVIDREIERAESRAERLREEMAETENTIAKLKAAREALNDPALKAVA